MTDLIERLRWNPDRLDDPLTKEAADEIERLTIALENAEVRESELAVQLAEKLEGE